ncbi:MAG: DoxX family protein [Pseudomonadota bacterium]
MRSTFGAETVRDVVLLVARILLVLLFVIFGWQKLIGFGGTVAYFSHSGVPMPFLAALVAVAMELVAGIAIGLGLFTRPLALLMALYTLGTALLGHPFWNLAGVARVEAEINFLKNVGLIGGFLLLYVTGAGRYSLDDKIDAI